MMRNLVLIGAVLATSAAIAAKIRRGRSSEDGESSLTSEPATESGGTVLGNAEPAPAGAEEIEAREGS